jgi:hypothetical protein
MPGNPDGNALGEQTLPEKLNPMEPFGHPNYLTNHGRNTTKFGRGFPRKKHPESIPAPVKVAGPV